MYYISYFPSFNTLGVVGDDNSFFFLLKKGFATLIREWPGELYNNMAIVQAVNDHLKRDPSNSILLKTLAEL